MMEECLEWRIINDEMPKIGLGHDGMPGNKK